MWRGWCDEDRNGGAVANDNPHGAPDANVAFQGDSIPAVRNLDSRIISHRLFPLKRWFYVNPLWYYHAPALKHRLNTNRRFYELVDPALRELCHFLFEAGLSTTPSCQGHFYPRDRFERVWDELNQEANNIRNEGLVVKDSETDQSFLLIDSTYSLAWPSFESFYRQASSHQNRGYLGITIPPDRGNVGARLQSEKWPIPSARLEFDPGLSEALGCQILCIYVDARSPEERDETWDKVTRFIRSAVELPSISG